MPKISFPYEGIDYRFEFLARAVFNCGRYGDPFHIANHDAYTGQGVKDRRPLSIVLHKLVFDYPDNEALQELEERVWTASSPDDFYELVEDTIKVYEGL